MSSPPVKYARYFDFTTFATLNPEKPLPGASVDVEFNRLKSTTDQTIDRLALIQRDDGGLRDGIITTASLADGSVTTAKLADQSVTNPKLCPNSVGTGNIAPGVIINSHLTAACVLTPNIADGAVTSPKLAANLVLGDISAHNFSVTNNAAVAGVLDVFGLLHAHQNFTVDGTTNLNGPVGLPFNCVGSAQVIDGSLQTADLADGSVTTPKLADQSVTAAKIAPGAISGGAIPDGAIPGAKLQDNSIPGVKLQDGAVTLAKMAPNSVDSSKIVDGTIAPTDLSAATIALMTAAGNPRGAWLTATNYASKDAVTNGNGVFVCITAHLSGVFATDLGAGKWYQTGTIYDQSLNTTDNVQHAHVGIGMAPTANRLDMALNQPAASIAQLTNADGSGAASAQFRATNLNTATDFGTFGSGFTTAGPAVPGYGFINAYGGGLSLNSVAAGPILFSTQNFIRMRLDAAGNLGIGMVPAQVLDITQPNAATAAAFLTNSTNGGGSAAGWAARNASGNSCILQMYAAAFVPSGIFRADGGLVWTNGAGGLSLSTGAATPIYFGINNVEKMRLDANGNLGLGVVPSDQFTWDVQKSFPSSTLVTRIKNLADGTNAAAGVNAEGNGAAAQLACTANSYTTNGNLRPQGGYVYSNGAGGFSVMASGGGTTVNVSAGGVSGGVYLGSGATAWAAISSEASKRDLRQLPGDPFHMIANHRVRVGHYADDPSDAPERPFLLFEDTERYYPWASAYQPPRTVEATDSNGKNPVTIHYPEMKGISLELYIPLLMLAMQRVDQRLKVGGL